MPTPYEDDYRNDIADTLATRDRSPFGRANTNFGKAMASLPQNVGQMPTQMPSGMPQTPAGGVPGSGMAPAAASILPTQAPAVGLTGQMPLMSQRGMAPPPQMGQLPVPQLGAMGQMPMSTPPIPPGLPPPAPMAQGVDQNGMLPPPAGRGRIY